MMLARQNLPPPTLVRTDPFKDFFFLELLDLPDDPIAGNADLVGQFLERKGRVVGDQFENSLPGFSLAFSPVF